MRSVGLSSGVSGIMIVVHRWSEGSGEGLSRELGRGVKRKKGGEVTIIGGSSHSQSHYRKRSDSTRKCTRIKTREIERDSQEETIQSLKGKGDEEARGRAKD